MRRPTPAKIAAVSEEKTPGAGEFDGKEFTRKLTGSPGVYRMLGAGGEVLYVGKAGNLKKRVGSYFLKPRMDPRIAAMVAQIAAIEVTLTRTEGEALLLEAQLIKSLRPRYNILLRDDKSYPYIYLSADEDYPRMGFHRGSKSGKGRYFGPYPSAYAVRESLNLMQKLFLVRQCEDSYFRNRSRPCLQYQIKRCSAPCVGLIGVPEYQDSARHAAMFLDGKSNEVIEELGAGMERASGELEFERAARLRDQIATLKRVQAQHYVQGASADLDVLACRIRSGVACVSVLFFRNGVNLGSRDFFPKPGIDAQEDGILTAFIAQYYLGRPIPHELIVSHELADAGLLAEVLGGQSGHNVEIKHSVRAERARFLELAQKNADAALAMHLASNRTMGERFESLRDLLDLGELPQRIECFDISHTMGEATVASCVVFGPEGPEKSQYRRFNITGVEPGDDYGAMRQVLERRYRRQQSGEGHLPDIVLIDGGKGQVKQALDVLADLAITGVLVVGVAKGPERRSGHESLIVGERVLWPGPESPALHLIDAVRDEAHRFAITGHRARRQKAREKSRLEEIGGIGAKRRAALLKHFGGLAGVASAGAEELARVKGVSRDLAERIYAAFHA
jgi:excinuclease ABC subunit C